jgi:branched-chain amino acid transport system permease protein
MDIQNFTDTFWSNTIDGLSLGAIYALIALGYTLVYGVLRLINFANSEVFMVGTFGSATGLWLLGIRTEEIKTGPALIAVLVLTFALAVLFSVITALLLEFVAYRPLRKRNAPRLVFLITAIGASLAIAESVGAFGAKKRDTYAFPRVWDTRHKLFEVGFGKFKGEVQVRNLVTVVGALLMMVALSLFVNKTRLGRGMRAVAQDNETSRILGVNVDRVILLTFVIGGVMAGGAAFLYFFYYESTKYTIGFLLGVKSFTAAVLGGIGNIAGALLGGLLLGLVENYGAALFGGKWKDVIAFGVLVLVLMFRPSGLLGEKLGRARA